MTETAAQDFEKLGLFYLGKRYDIAEHKVTSDLVLYDSKDLLTHAVCIGMTGSGKTGLCLSLVEEAAIDHIPVIAIDPKGDLSNLLLTFPHLSKEEFLPWVNADEAANKGISADEFAMQQAEAWKSGLAEWGQDVDRIKRLRAAADLKIFTPGSTAGTPISIVQSLAAPGEEILDDNDALRERVTSTANCLLSLLGTSIDPLKSREHILLSNILDRAWRDGKDLTLPDIIQQIQKPPMTQVGAIDIESFYPAKERFELAMTVNNLLASPGFDAWLTGEPLDIDALLHNSSGKPQVSIFSIAHLGDTERMFFVSMLLGQLVSWMRSQSGTSSLRAILYMDEIFGYFPPVANPPSKTPLITLLKQARAYGLGLVLASQNPVDLDYKGLSNTGTWFIGRLQTQRDKMRVLEGLEGVAAETGGAFDRPAMQKLLSSLDKRVFLMNNVHESRPVLFQTRWTLSYLRGPLMKKQIKDLMAQEAKLRAPNSVPVDDALRFDSSTNVLSAGDIKKTSGRGDERDSAKATQRPALPPDVRQYFMAPRGATPEKIVYKPFLYGNATLRFTDAKTNLDETSDRSFVATITGDGASFNWNDAQLVKYPFELFESEPIDGAEFQPLPPGLAQSANFKKWTKSFAIWLSASQKYHLLSCPSLKMYSRSGEQEGAFKVRVQQKSNELRDELKDKLREKFSAKLTSLENRIQTAQQRVEKNAQAARDSQINAAMSVGATIFGAVMSRRPFGSTTMNRTASAARASSRAAQKQADTERANETLQNLQEQYAELNAQFNQELSESNQQIQANLNSIEVASIAPKKANIVVNHMLLLWIPA